MKYAIEYTDSAMQDIRNIYGYISETLLEPEIASNQAQRIMKEIRSLEEMPLRYRLYDDEPWHSKGLRFFPVDNYLVFYLPDEETGTVKIIRVMYGGKDIKNQLDQ